MQESLVVALKIVAMFIVIALGYGCRRRNVIDAPSTGVLSRLCTDVTLPALIFLQMVETVDADSLRVSWSVPLLAIVGMSLGFVLGWATWRLCATRSQAPVFIFASGISNWIYLPLPIVDQLYGKEGLQILFLCNIGIQVLFWTVGVAILHGGHLDAKSLKNLASNPGLIAAVLGIIVASFKGPAMMEMAARQPMHSAILIGADAMRLLGQATIPISLIVTGAQIAAAAMVQRTSPRPIAGVMANRLILAPLAGIAFLCAFHAVFPALPSSALLVIALILLMPVSVTSTVLAERMNQDTALAAQSVLYTTLASVFTVPLLFVLARYVLDT